MRNLIITCLTITTLLVTTQAYAVEETATEKRINDIAVEKANRNAQIDLNDAIKRNDMFAEMDGWLDALKAKKSKGEELNTAERELGGLLELALTPDCTGGKPTQDCESKIKSAYVKGTIVFLPEEKAESVTVTPPSGDNK